MGDGQMTGTSAKPGLTARCALALDAYSGDAHAVFVATGW